MVEADVGDEGVVCELKVKNSNQTQDVEFKIKTSIM